MKTTGYLFRIGVTVSAILAAILAFGISRDNFIQSRLMRKSVRERAVTAVNLTQSGIEKGIQTGDDILLLLQLESLSRSDDAQAAYILDRSGKVFMHTRTPEWGREYKDPFSRAAAAASEPLFQEIPSPHSYLYAVPVSSQAVLCVSYSAQKNDEALSASRRRFLLAGLVFFIIIYLFFHVFALLPFKKSIASLAAALKGIVPGTPGRVPPLNGECGEIGRLVNGILDKCGTETPSGEVASVSSEKTVSAYFAGREECAALFDEENRLVAATPSAREFCSFEKGEGEHIIELLPPEVIAAAQEARKNPGTPARNDYHGMTIESRVIFDGKNAPAGLLVRKVSE